MDATGLLAAEASDDLLRQHVAQRLDMFERGATVLLGCSGGPDSVGLLQLVADVRPDLAMHVVYVDHGLKDTTAERSVVAGHAAAVGALLTIVPVAVASTGHGLEAAARNERYAALFATATAGNAAAVLVAHTADDLAETVWMRLLRGTGPDGLSAMKARDGMLVRPLLAVRRVTLHRYVTALGAATVHDPMNDDARFQRVMLRQQLVPLLQTLADDPVGAAWRLAFLAGDDQAYFAQMINATVPIMRFGSVAAVVSRDVLNDAPMALRRRVVRQMLHAVRAKDTMTSRHSDLHDVMRVIDATTASRFTLATDVEVAVDARYLSVATRMPQSPQQLANDLACHVAAFDVALGRDVNSDGFTPPAFGMPKRYAVRLLDTGPLTLRTFCDGDTVFTRGQERPLTTLFHAGHLPVLLRRHWPVVCALDSIVWVPGFAANDAALAPANDTAAPLWSFTGARDAATRLG